MDRNKNMPFTLKRKVLRSALMSAILYASETWTTQQLAKMESVYMSSVKHLLGVRQTTPNIMCLLELGLPDLKKMILKKQMTFMQKFTAAKSGEEPLALALELCNQAQTPMARRLQEAERLQQDPETSGMEELRQLCREKAITATKFSTYMRINPQLEVHEIYTCQNISEYMRVQVSRLRLSAHRLKIETGRWQRQPRDQRTCTCDSTSVQDEEHVTLHCSETAHLRTAYGVEANSLAELFRTDPMTLGHFVYDVLNCFM